MQFSNDSLEGKAENDIEDSLIGIARARHHCPLKEQEPDFFLEKGKTEEPAAKQKQPSFGNDGAGSKSYNSNNSSLKNVSVGCACCGWKATGEQLIGAGTQKKQASVAYGENESGEKSTYGSGGAPSGGNSYSGESQRGKYG